MKLDIYINDITLLLIRGLPCSHTYLPSTKGTVVMVTDVSFIVPTRLQLYTASIYKFEHNSP